MAKIKRNLSLEEEILNKGLNRAKQLGFTFSAYITFLINNDSDLDVITPVIKKNDSVSNVDTDVLNEVDNILSI